jgi:hypothetical protein
MYWSEEIRNKMKNIKITTCSIVYDANTVPYIERINYSGSRDYLVLTETDNIWFTDNRIPSVFASGIQADFSIGKKGPNLTSYKIEDMLPTINNFLINYNHHWWFIHGKFHIENYPNNTIDSVATAKEYFVENICKIQAHLEKWKTEMAIDSLS